MPWTKRALWGLTCWLCVSAMEVQAGTYAARVRWQPSSDPALGGYRVYSRLASGAWGTAQDAGKPAPASDGTVSFTLTNLNVEGDYAFAVSVYATGGAESARSNERALGYLQVAPVVDSDADGLRDAQEDVNLNRVVDAGESNPDSADSDGDGVGDAADACEGTAGGSPVNPQGCSCAQTPGCAPCTTSSQCNDNNACTTDSCTGGTCRFAARTDGTACGDGNACNGAETCQAGQCTAGSAPSCNDANPCTADSCNASTGCVYAALANGSSCGDGNACNGTEVCQGGACSGGTPLTCNDGNPCTADTCSASAGCRFTSKANGASCSDGNQCNGGETCQSGTCSAGAPLACNDGNSCTTDSCNPSTGCSYAPVAGCNGCLTASDCNDGDSCTADACTAGTCVNTVRADGTACNDGVFCTVGETCVAGSCGGGEPNCASQATACKDARCDEERHACVTEPLANGTACGEADTCSAAPTCQFGSCIESTALACDDQNPCTADACDPAGGCTHTPAADGTSCADRDFCDGAETCRAGACVPASAPECDDGNSCTIDTCDARRRRCSHVGTSICCTSDAQCGDGDLCTTNERCSQGRCTSDPVSCPRGGRCDLSACDPAGGCQLTPLPEGSSCEDGDPCTSGESCRAGQCVLPSTALPAAAAAATGQTLVVDKFILKPLGKRGTRLSARGTFTATAAPDPSQGDVMIEVRDPEGWVIYSATVPGSELISDRGGTRYLYWIRGGETPVHNGLQKLLLVLDGNTVDIVAKGVIPAAATPEALTRGHVRPETFSESSVAWAAHLFDRCWSDPNLECKKWRRWLTWCR